jgi:hypothetical protein
MGTILFFGGPWDGEIGRYLGLHAYQSIAATGGRYVFLDRDCDGSVVYVFVQA